MEAAGEDVFLSGDEVSFRMNLATLSGGYESGVMTNYNGDGIDGEDARTLASSLVEDPAFAALMEKAGMRLVKTEKDGLAVGNRTYDKLSYEYRGKGGNKR